jgi:hypothetical protein
MLPIDGWHLLDLHSLVIELTILYSLIMPASPCANIQKSLTAEHSTTDC